MSTRRLLLLFSLSLNLCFVLGYTYVQGVVKKFETSRGRMELALDSLKPDSLQHEALVQATEEWTQKMRAHGEAHGAEVNQYWAAMQNDDTPAQTMHDSCETICKMQTERLQISMDYMRSVMLKLDPQQRKKLAEMIHDANKF